MRIYLDLLPDERKQEKKKKKLFKKILRQELRFFMPVVSFIIILTAININLKIQLDSLDNIYSAEQSRGGYKNLKEYEDKFREINMKTSSIAKFQERHLYWSALFYNLSNLIPEGVFINGLSTKDYQVSLTGKAKTRENLLSFQEKIKASDCFSEVNVPLSNLVNRENVDFQIDFKLKKNCLNK